MARVLLVQVDGETAAFIRHHLSSAYRGEIDDVATLEKAFAQLGHAGNECDVIVVGPSVEQPLTVAQRVYALDREVPVVLLSKPARYEQLARAVQFAPLIGRDVRCRSSDDREALVAELREVLADSRRRRSYQATLATMLTLPSVRAPATWRSNVPSTASRATVTQGSQGAVGVVAIDGRGQVVAWNQAATHILGHLEGITLAGSVARFFPEAVRDAVDRLIDGDSTGVPGQSLIVELPTAGARPRLVEVLRAAPARPPGGPAEGSGTGILVMLRDVTARVGVEHEQADRARELALAAAVGAALASSEPLAAKLRGCAEVMAHLLPVASVRIWTLDEAEGTLELQASAGTASETDIPRGRVAVGDRAIGRLARERRPYITNSVGGNPYVDDGDWAARAGMVAYAGYPLSAGHRLVGAFAVFARQPLTDATTRALAFVADEIALGIDQAMTLSERDRLLIRERAARSAAEAMAAERAAILRHIADGVIVADAAGRISFANEAARRLFPISRLGIPVASLDTMCQFLSMDGAPLPAEESQLLRAVQRGETVLDVRWRIRWPDGTERVEQGSASPVLLEDGTRFGAVLVLRDVTAHEALERQKDEFLGSVSHDLKNPLTSIKGSVQLLRRYLTRGAPSPERLEVVLSTIDQALQRMGAQLDAMLDQARLQMSRPLDLVRQPTDLVALVHRVVAECQMTTDRHRLRVHNSETRLVGSWDGERLNRVVSNLLTNAIKYSPDGGTITVAVRHESQAGSTPRAASPLAGQAAGVPDVAVLSVRDEGIGIPEADRPHIFERFARGQNVAGTIVGTGIGLADVHQIVVHHGGTISVESREGAGSTFTVRLPLLPVPAPEYGHTVG